MKFCVFMVIVSFCLNMWGQATVKDTIVHSGWVSYRVNITSNENNTSIVQILSGDSTIIVQDTTEYSADLSVKQQDCNNDGLPDLLICADRECELVDLLYITGNQHTPFARFDIPSNLKKEHFTMHSVSGRPDYFCSSSITLCTDSRGEIEGMHPLNNVIVFRINRRFEIEKHIKIDHNDCQHISKALLYKYIHNKLTYVKTIHVPGMNPFPNVTYINEHFEELMRN